MSYWVRYPVWQHTFVSPSAFSRRAVVSYWRQYVHEVLVNRLGGLSLPRKSVVRLTDRPDMTLDVYRGRKTTIQPTNQYVLLCIEPTEKYLENYFDSKHLKTGSHQVCREFQATESKNQVNHPSCKALFRFLTKQ